MTLEEIKAAVIQGERVFWSNTAYEVKKFSTRSGEDQWLIICNHNDHCIGLTWKDKVTMNGKVEEFFIAE